MPLYSLLIATIIAAPVASGAQSADGKKDIVCPTRIHGRVLDETTGEPIPKVAVVAGNKRTESDRDGAFEVILSCDSSRVEFSRADYESSSSAVDRSGQPLTVLLSPRVVSRMADAVVIAPAPTPSAPKSTTALDASALRDARGKNLAEALSRVPGVSQLRSGATSKPIIRGQQGRRLLIVYDGIRHEGQKWGLDHGPEIDPLAAGRIRVVKGAASVRYGPDAIGGVIDLAPRDFPTTPGLYLQSDQSYNSNGHQGLLALRLDSVGNGIEGLAVRVDVNGMSGADRSAPDYILANTAQQVWNAGTELEWSGERRKLRLAFRHHDFTAGINGYARSESPETFFAQLDSRAPLGSADVQARRAIGRPKQRVTHELAVLRWNEELDIGELKATYSFQLNRRQEFDLVRSGVSGAQADFRLRTHALELALASDWTPWKSTNFATELGISASYQGNEYTGLPLVPNYISRSIGVFARGELTVDAWLLEAGARLDVARRRSYLTNSAFSRLRATSSEAESICSAGAEAARCDSSFAGPSATAGSSYAFSPVLSASLSASFASRFPAIDEQFANGTAPSLPIFSVGDPGLTPEFSRELSLTLRAEGDKSRLEVSGFLNSIDDYIFLAPDRSSDGSIGLEVLVRGSFPRFVTRQRDALFWGGEASGSYALFGKTLELRAEASVVRAQLTGSNGYLPLVPPERGRVALRYSPPTGPTLYDAFLEASFLGVLRQGRSDLVTDLAPAPPGYTLVGVKAGTSFDWEGTEWTITVEAENILNTSYRSYTSLLRYFSDQPGREIIVRLAQAWPGSL